MLEQESQGVHNFCDIIVVDFNNREIPLKVSFFFFIFSPLLFSFFFLPKPEITQPQPYHSVRLAG